MIGVEGTEVVSARMNLFAGSMLTLASLPAPFLPPPLILLGACLYILFLRPIEQARDPPTAEEMQKIEELAKRLNK